MKKKRLTIILLAVVLLVAAALVFYRLNPDGLSFRLSGNDSSSTDYSGTQSCRECHEKFYQLWAPSHHGLAMQPFTAELFQTKLTVHDKNLAIGDSEYRMEFDGKQAWVGESGPEGNQKYPLVHAMGGKNVYYHILNSFQDC